MKVADLKDEAIRARKDHAATATWIERYRAGDPAAGNVLVMAHTPLVMNVAQRFTRVGSRDWEDCVQEGCLGILKAAETYDPAKGAPSTHLWTWIRQRVSRFVIDRCHLIRRPVHLYSGRNGSAAKAHMWKPLAFMFSELLSDSHEAGDHAFEDSILDEHLPAEEELADHDHALACKRLAPWMLWHIGARERRILSARFGLTTGEEQTLQEIGDRIGVTRERIRQLEDEALDACWAVVPPAAFETFDAWVARALAVKEQRDAVEAERVGYLAKGAA